MVKKTEKFDFETDDSDLSFGFGNDDSEGQFQTKNTGGRRRSITEFSGTFLSSFKKGLLTKDVLRRLVDKSAPSGYLRLWDTAASTGNAIDEIYSTSKQEASKIAEELKEPIEQINKVYGNKYLGNKASNKVGGWASNRSGSYQRKTELDYAKEDLKELFDEIDKRNQSSSSDTQNAIDESANKNVAATLTNTKATIHASRVFERAAVGIERIVAYQDNVQYRIAKKELALRLKQYGTQRQILDEQQQTRSLLESGLKAIIKNTGLPEAVKITNLELAGQAAKQEVWGSAGRYAQRKFSDIAAKLLDRTKTFSTDFIQNMGTQLSGVASGLSGMATQAEIEEELGMRRSRASKMGGATGTLGALAAEYLLGRLGPKFKKRLSSNSKVAKISDSILNFSDSSVNYFDRYVDNPSNPWMAAILSATGIGDLAWRDNIKVRGTAIRDFDKQTYFTMQTQIAITEVIPGHLERIGHLLEIMQTGDSSVSPVRYNYETGRFDTVENIKDNLSKRFVNSSHIESVNKHVESILEQVDPDKKLSANARGQLKRYIVSEAQKDNGRLDLRALVSDDSPIGGSVGEEIANVVGESLDLEYLAGHDRNNIKQSIKNDMKGSATYQRRAVSTNQLLNTIRDYLPRDLQQAINQSRAGNLDILEELGIVTRVHGEARLDRERELDMLLGNTRPPVGPKSNSRTTAAPPMGGLNRGSRTDRIINPPQPQPIQNDMTSDTGEVGFTSFQQELLSTIERMSAKTSVDISNQLLDAIRIAVESGGGSGGDSSSGQGGNSGAARNNWFRRLIATPIIATGRGIKNYYKRVGGIIPAAFKTLIQKPLQAAGSITSSILNSGTAKSIMSINVDSVKNKLMDVYVAGREKVALRKKDLELGEYIDANTKKVITKLKDITGPVIDKMGNIVITEEEFRSGLSTIKNGRLVSLLGGVFSGAKSLASGYLNLITKPYKALGSLGKWTYGKLMGSRGSGGDLYVKGETTPRLLVNLLNSGRYLNDRGKILRKFEEIDGTVYDTDGNVVLTLADITKGLVDKAGNAYKSSTGSLLTKVIKGAMGAARGYLRFVGGIYKGAFNKVKSLFTGRGKKTSSLSMDGLPVEIMAHHADTTDRIYDLLDKRLKKPKKDVFGDSDGDGIREGSRESWLKRLQNLRNKGTEETEGKDKKEKRGLFGILGAIAGGIGGIVGAVKGFGSRIFSTMKFMMKLRAGAGIMNALGGIGSLLAAIITRGKAKTGLFSKLGRGMSKIPYGKLAVGVGGLFAAQQVYSAWGADSTTSTAISDAERKTLKEIEKSTAGDLDLSGSGGGGGGGGRDGRDGGGDNKEGKNSFWENLKNSVTGSILGEAGAIATAGGAALLYDKFRKKSPAERITTPSTPASQGTGRRILDLATKNKYGRLVTAGLLGAGVYTGTNMLLDNKEDVSVEESTRNSYLATLGIDAGLALGIPYLGSKIADWKANRAAKARPAYSSISPTNAAQRAPFLAPGQVIPQTTAASKVPWWKAAGKSVGKHAGILGVGLAGLSAANTEGGFKEKGTEFAKSLAINYGIGKGLSMLGGQAGRAALMTGGRMALTSLAGSLGPMLLNPYVLGAAAIIGVGYLGYKAYKKWFAKDKDAIVRFRMAQYGFDLNDKNYSGAILGLEEKLSKYISVRKGAKTAKFERNMPIEELINLFGVDPSDKERLNILIHWFYYRFRPVYLTAMSVYYNATGSLEIAKADTVLKTREKKLAYLQATKTPFSESGNPYDFILNPFTGKNDIQFNSVKVQTAYEKAVKSVNKDKTDADVKVEAKKAADRLNERKRELEQKREWLQNDLDERAVKQRELDRTAEQKGDAYSKRKAEEYRQETNEMSKSGGSWWQTNSTVRGIRGWFNGLGAETEVKISMSKSQKEWQLMVYKAFMNAGFSDGQARILTAEIGRENSYNPKYLFAGHADPHSGSNLGMMSWQGDRKPRLIQFLRQMKVLNPNNTMKPGQEALNAQAKFIMWELKNTHSRVGKQFLANPNPDPAKAFYLIGKSYIKWRIDDPLYKSKGEKNRNGFYAMLNKQLGTKTGTNATKDTPASAAPPYLMRNNKNEAPPSLVKNGKVNVPTVNTGAFGGARLPAGGGVYRNPASAGAANNQTIDQFISTLNPKLIEAGRKATLIKAGVNIKGMNQKFMIIFYALVGDYCAKTGVSRVGVNSAFRSREEQAKLYADYKAGRRKSPAARPGNSRHESGVAIDVDSVHTNKMDQLGLLAKYQFHRPVRSETWHLENRLFGNAAATAKALKDSVKAAPTKTDVKLANNTSVDNNGKVVNTSPNPNKGTALDPKNILGTMDANGKVTRGQATIGDNNVAAGTIVNPETKRPMYDQGREIVEQNKKVIATREAASQPVKTPTQIQQERNSTRVTEDSNTTAQKMAAEQHRTQKDMLGIQTEQLSVQKEILKSINEMKSAIGSIGQSKATPPSEPTPTQMREVANQRKAADNNIPVSMNAKQ